MMEVKNKKPEEIVATLVERLNKALRVEYTFIIHYPFIANLIQDEAARKLAIELGVASVHHAEVVANIISKLGGKPDWSFEPFPEGVDTKKLFQNQLAKERLAMQLHRGSAELVPAGSYRRDLNVLADEEEQHIQVVERILSRLNNQ
jgi:bacterioferritin (cytochrome b1)